MARAQGTAEVRNAMDRLCRELALVDLDALRPGGVEDEDAAILVAERIPLETWSRFAELDVLPRGLRLRQLVWDDGRVWIVEYPISRAHEAAGDYCRSVFDAALPFQLFGTGQANLAGPSQNGRQVTYSADYSFRPVRSIPGLQVPQGVVIDEWVTVIVEVMRSQQWRFVRPKVAMYRQLPGVQFIFCLKMSNQTESLVVRCTTWGSLPIQPLPTQTLVVRSSLGLLSATTIISSASTPGTLSGCQTTHRCREVAKTPSCLTS